MTSKKFVLKTLFSIIGIIIFVVVTNLYINEFGLFGDVKDKMYRVYIDEKTTKYLFSFNYIPSNFDGILVGPSLSDQMMNTKKIENHKIYNLSMDGGNISELKYAIDNVLKFGNIDTFIICLDPYITKNSGLKTSQINSKAYYSTLGSLFTIKYYVLKYLKHRRGTNSVYHDSYWGYTDTEYAKKDENATLNINKNLKKLNDETYNFDSLKIDEIAYKELQNIIMNLRKKDIKIIAYYFPTAKRIFEHPDFKQSYSEYRIKINKLLNYSSDIIIDFATDEYDYIRNNDSSYSDGSHLSRIGAKKILKVLNKKINE